MPYGQILEIMVALILLSGAPEKAPLSMSPLAGSALWALKAACWYAVCASAFKLRDKGSRSRISRIEFWEWAALLPFAADIYFLGAGSLFGEISSLFNLDSIKDILGLLLFFLYISMVWSADLRSRESAQVLRRTVLSRLRLLFPIILPYFILVVSADILEKLPLPFLQRLLSSEYSDALFFVLFILFFLFLLPPLVVRLWRCNPLPQSDLRHRIEGVLAKQKIRFSDIMLWTTGETMACTAAVMGILPGFRYILLTPCLIKYLLPQEIEAVIAHEVEHVRRRHILWYVLFLASFSAILYRLAGPVMTWLLSTQTAIKFILFTDTMPTQLISLLSALPIGILIILYFRFLMGFFMRNFERQADMAAFKIHGHPFFLINALKKVALLSGINPEKPNWHHFSIAERINFLENAYENPQLLSEHEHRINLTRGIFVVTVCVLLALPSALPVKTWKDQAHSNILKLYYKKLAGQDEKNPRLYLLLGEIAFEQKRYPEAVEAYKKALEIDPENAEALNNLAWLYIKAEDPRFRHPKDALLLAMEAARIRPESFILDTLAECLFQNGYADQALKTEEEALKKARKNRAYYEKQIRRFKKKLKKAS